MFPFGFSVHRSCGLCQETQGTLALFAFLFSKYLINAKFKKKGISTILGTSFFLASGARMAQWLEQALASRHCGAGSIPRLGVICGLSLLVLFSAPRGVSPGTPGFPSPQKPTFCQCPQDSAAALERLDT